MADEPEEAAPMCPLMSKVISYKEPRQVPWTEEYAQENLKMSLDKAYKAGYDCVSSRLERIQSLIVQPCVESKACRFWVQLEEDGINWTGCAIVSMAHDLAGRD